MQRGVTGKIDTGTVVRQNAEASLDATLEKYFQTEIEAHLASSKESHLSQAGIFVDVGLRVDINAGAAAETFAAFHARSGKAVDLDERARAYLLVPLAEEGEKGLAVAAEISTGLGNLTVGRAVVQVEVADASVLPARHRSRGQLNMVSCLPGGNFGQIDLALDLTQRTPHGEA